MNRLITLDVTMTWLIISAIAPIIGACFMFAGKALTWNSPFIFSKVAVWLFIGVFLYASLSAWAQIALAVEDPERLGHIWPLTLFHRMMYLPAGFVYWLSSLEMVGRLPTWVLPGLRKAFFPFSAPMRWLKKKISEADTTRFLGGLKSEVRAKSVEAIHAASSGVVPSNDRRSTYRLSALAGHRNTHHRPRKGQRQPH